MTPAQITGSTFRGGLLRGVLAGAVALLVVYGVLFLTSSEQTATAQAPCEQGTAVPDPSNNPGLVRDCAILLAAKDTLRGTATLDWNASTAVADWTGITVAGTPPRVLRVVVTDAGLEGTIPAALGGLEELQQLNLGDNALTGTIPGELGGLSKLWLLHLAGNDLTGPLPAELVMIERLQILRVGGNRLTGEIPEALFGLTYLDYVDLSGNQLTGSIPPIPANRFDMQGILLDGNQLSGPIPVGLGELDLTLLQLSGNQLTGCIPQGLRDVSLHGLDDLGLPDCTTTTTYDLTMSAGPNGRSSPPPGRYAYLNGSSVTVTAMPNEGYQVARWTGDCRPALTATTCTLTMDADKTARVRFARITHTLTVTAGEGGSVTPGGTTTHNQGDEVTLTASWNDATHDLSWGGDCAGTTVSTCELTMDANKNVTATFTALPATRCATPADADCIRAVYLGAPGDYAQVSDIPAEVLLTPAADGRYYVERGRQYTVVTAAPLPEGWTRFYLQRTPLGDPRAVSHEQLIKPVGTTYTFTVTDDEAAATLITLDLTAARPFVRPRPDGKPELGDVVVTTVFSVATMAPRYSTYDTTGGVATAGSYVFLSDPADTTTAVTTYEALRDGTATGLLIHKSDAYGASQAALYDTVEAGDLFEWRQADDCFVRYLVTEVKPDPTGTVPRKLLAVEWMTYAFTGCSGAVSENLATGIDFGPLPDLGGTDLISPVRHGIFQVVPEDWTGAIDPGETHELPEGAPPYPGPYAETRDVTVARGFPYWREPQLPTGWRFSYAFTGGLNVSHGYCAFYEDVDGWAAVEICGEALLGPGTWRMSSAGPNTDGTREYLYVREARWFSGRPAAVRYSPEGPLHHRSLSVRVWVHDVATQSIYTVVGVHRTLLGSNVEDVIAIAHSLFEGTNRP